MLLGKVLKSRFIFLFYDFLFVVIETFESVLSSVNEKFFQSKLDLQSVDAACFKEYFPSAQNFELFSFLFEMLHVKQTIRNSYVVNNTKLIWVS